MVFKKIKAGIINTGLKFFSLNEKIVRLFLGTSLSDIRPIVILPAVDISLNKIVDKLDDKKKKGKIYNGKLNGVDVSVIQTKMGSPQTSVIMESLRRTGCKVAIRIDFCGGLTKTRSKKWISQIEKEKELQNETNFVDTGIDIGDLIIPKEVFLTDVTSMGYLQKYSDLIQKNSLLNSYQQIDHLDIDNKHLYRKYPSFDGNYWTAQCNREIYEIFTSKLPKPTQKEENNDITWTHEALFTEDEKEINTWRAYGCNSVDMESCIIYLLGALFDISVISVLSVSDLPDFKKYTMLKSNNFHPKTLTGLDDAIKYTIDLLPDTETSLC